jgi:hypothetical protein
MSHRENIRTELTMTSRHELFLNIIRDINQSPADLSSSRLDRLSMAQQDFATDVDVLNYALTLEHLEAAFYEMSGMFELGEDAYGNSIGEYVAVIGEHEAAHVATLTDVITQLGGEPVARAEYDFGVTDAATFLATAATLENVGVAAYDGAGAAIQDPELLTAAGSIVAVEARHAAYLNLITGTSPFPAAVETPLSMSEVLDAAGPFIAGN